MRKIWYILLLLVVSSACTDKWDNFYGEGEDDDRAATAKINLWEAIEQEPNYSKFKLLLEKTGLDKELQKGRILTVWLPLDNYITEEEMNLDSSDMRRFVLNHMNPLALYKTKLGTKNEIETLARKYVRIDGGGDNVNIEDNKVSKFDVVCTNGVIHEINGLLIPMQNIMEYLVEECGDEYSVFKDSLFAYNDTVFNREDSYSIGIDSVGQTIYDSVFDITNSLLGYVDFLDEKKTATLFLPTNDVITEMIVEVQNRFLGLGLEMTKLDTLSCFEFLMGATFISGEWDNLSGIKQLHTNGGKLLRFDKQIVSTNYEQCSNGIVYEFQTAYMPYNVFMKKVEYLIPDLFGLPENEWSKYCKVYNDEDRILNNNETSNEKDTVNNLYFNTDENHQKSPDWKFLSVKAAKGESIELTLLQKDISGNMNPVKLMPGKYKMTGKGYSPASANVRISLSGKDLIYQGGDVFGAAAYNGGKVFPMGQNTWAFAYNYDEYKLMCDTITIGINQSEYDSFIIESDGTSYENKTNNIIRIRALKLEPVGDNY